jgi:hypothetical protein
MIMHLIILGGVGVAGTGTAITVGFNGSIKPSGKIGPVNRFSTSIASKMATFNNSVD